MKKILMGLLALSSLTFATPVTGTEDSATNTPVFSTGEEGRINVTGTLVASSRQDVKYVVFTSADGTLTEAEDTLNLSNIIISYTPEEFIFENGEPNKVYVKRIVNGELQSLTEHEEPFLKLTGTEYDSGLASEINLAVRNVYPITMFISSSTLTEAVKAAYPSATTVKINNVSEPIVDSKVIRLPKGLSVTQTERGIFEFSLATSYYLDQPIVMPAEEGKPFIKYLAKHPLSGEVAFKVSFK